MSFTRKVTIWCDDCLNLEEVNGTLTRARAEVKKLGWAHIKRNDRWIDLCRNCSSKRKETTNE